MKTSKNLLTNVHNSTKFIFEPRIIFVLIIIIALIAISRRGFAQVDFDKIPKTQHFTNNGVPITIKNIQFTQYDKELNCTWKTSHAQISGLVDTKNQDFINDWLSGMSYFGNCEGDKECYDFQSFHFYYKLTRVSLIRNDLLAFYLHEGNCKATNDSCVENQDWEIYDLRSKHFLQESEIFRQAEKSQKELLALIENKVIKQKYNLVNDWQAYTRQIGLDGNNIIIYLNNDILNNTKGITLRFKASEIYRLLEPCIEKRLYFKNCDTDTQKLTFQE